MKNIQIEGLSLPQTTEYNQILEAQICQLEAENHQLKKIIHQLHRQIDQLMDQFRLAQKARFGPSSEKARYILDDGVVQETLFNEAEATAPEAPEDVEDELVVVERHTRKRKRTKEELADSLPVVEEVIDLEEDERSCGICEGELQPIGREFVRRVLEIIPARQYLSDTYRVNYSCPDCLEETDEANIVKPEVPTPVVKRGLASPSSIAHVMHQKYVNAQPLYRQEKDWENFGVKISRGTLANWVIYTATLWFAPLLEAWKAILVTAKVILADETVVQVLKEPDKTPQSESRMWVYATGRAGPFPIILYEYQPNRSGDNAQRFLAGAKDFFLLTDGYAGYNKVANATHCGCWAHQRRKWEQAMPKSPPRDNPAYIGLRYCQKLFALEAAWDDENCSPQERLKRRLEQSKPIFDEYYSWVATLNFLSGSKLAEAVTYARNQKGPLSAFLLDGHIDISTNKIENAIRPFAVGRKNWLFADSVKGAKSSAMVYSIVETAKANALRPYEYLLYLLTELPTILTHDPNADLSHLHPWAKGIADRCHDLKKTLDFALVDDSHLS
jgi:transposase